ncbi:MAG: hypothetical protein ACYDG2_20665 [Ruminiclostridium sp.]
MDNIIERKVIPEDSEDIFILNLGLGYFYIKEKLRERIQYILDNTLEQFKVLRAGQ